MFIVLLAISLAMPAQCPSSDSIYRRINEIVNAPSVTENELQRQLLQLNEQINRCPNRNDSAQAFLFRRMGVSYNKMGNYTAAIDWTIKAIEIIRQNVAKPSVNYSHLANCYYNLQMYYDSLGMESFRQQAVDSCISVDYHTGVYNYSSYLWNDKLVMLFNKGDYVLCAKFAELTEKNFEDYFPERIGARWSTVVHHANALIFLNKSDEAEQFLLSKIKFFRIDSCYVQAYGLLGMINANKKSYQKALDYFQKTADVAKKMRDLGNYGWAMNWMGFIYADGMRNYSSAMNSYRKAILYADSIDAPSVLCYIANLYVRRNLFDSAFYFFQKSFDRIKPGMTEKDLVKLNLTATLEGKAIEYVVRLINYKAEAFLDKYRVTRNQNLLGEAIEIYKIADKLLNQVKTRQLDPETKLFWRAHTRSLYENAIEASYLSGNIESGFYFFEKGRAVLLNDQLNEQRWIAEKDIVKKSKIENEIMAYEKEMAQLAKSSARYSELEKQVYKKRQELERLQETIKANNPLYYQNYLDRNFIALKDVRDVLLKDHQALVELFSGDSVVYLMCITSKQAVLQKIDKKQFDSLSQSFSRFLSSSELLNRNFSEFSVVSHQLYRLIFGNIELPIGRIIISPDGQYFPFEALISRRESVHYFINDYAVSYTYSARWLLNDFGINSTSATKTFLGVAPVIYSNGLPALRGSDESLRRIQYYFNHVTQLIKENASKKNFIDQFADYRIIQLYTHATANGSMGEPTIYFSDSALSISELFYGRRPATSLVVLAACETGLGDLHPGEGVFSFNRAFAALGIPSAVSNLWEVDNRSSYKITELFYKNIANGLPLDVALQKAKIEYFFGPGLENKLPYFWAAPILVGQTNKISGENTSWRWMALVVLFLLIAIWLEARISKKKQKHPG
jgi:CHAT domain-containing protein